MKPDVILIDQSVTAIADATKRQEYMDNVSKLVENCLNKDLNETEKSSAFAPIQGSIKMNLLYDITEEGNKAILRGFIDALKRLENIEFDNLIDECIK